MNEIISELSGSILRVELNRPSKRNAMTSRMYVTLADLFNDAAKDERTRVVLWHGAGDSFCAGNDLEDFLKNPPGPGESPQARLMYALVDSEKPLVAAVQGAAIGGGTTMLTHCDFVYAGGSAKFQMPFINLAVVPEFGSSCSIPARIGHIRAAELILLGLPSTPGVLRIWDSSPRSCPIRTCWGRQAKPRGSWQRSRPARCKPASNS